MTHKPDGYPTVSPYLLVPDAAAVLRFTETVFGAERLRVVLREGAAGLAHAEARIGDSVVMMGEVADAAPAHIHVYRADVDACFARAEALGGQVVQPPNVQPDGAYRGGVAHPTGTVWWISREPA